MIIAVTPLPAEPSTALSRAAVELLERTSPPVLVAHCRRTYAFGAHLLRQAGRPFDAEPLFVGSCLHDLGLLPENDDGSTPFQLRGAELAEAFVREHGGSDPAVVRDAVALHLELTTADHPVAEVAGVSLGAAVDVLGLRLDLIPADVVDAVLQARPRGDMKAFFVDAMLQEAQRKPTSTVAGYVRDLDFAALIAAAPYAS